MNWGKSIVLSFVLFAGFIATLVTVCVRQDVNLVTKDYYKDEIDYQHHIDRLAHTAMLELKPSIDVEQGLVKVSYADFKKVQHGVLTMFRPSDPAQDKVFALRREEKTVQYFSTQGMQKGMYRARLVWTMNGEEFFVESIINL